MVDYLAVEQADPDALERIGQGLKAGAEAAGIEIPGGELAVLPELIRGHPSPHGFDLCGDGDRHGRARRDRDRRRGRAGRRADRRALLRPALQRLHARAPRAAGGRRPRPRRPPAGAGRRERRRRAARADRDLRARGARPAALRRSPSTAWPTSPAAACCNLLRLGGDRVGYAIEDPLPVPAGLRAHRPRSATCPAAEMWEVFNMGCGFVAVVPEADAADAAALLAGHHPGARRIGTVTDRAGHGQRPRASCSAPAERAGRMSAAPGRRGCRCRTGALAPPQPRTDQDATLALWHAWRATRGPGAAGPARARRTRRWSSGSPTARSASCPPGATWTTSSRPGSRRSCARWTASTRPRARRSSSSCGRGSTAPSWTSCASTTGRRARSAAACAPPATPPTIHRHPRPPPHPRRSSPTPPA